MEITHELGRRCCNVVQAQKGQEKVNAGQECGVWEHRDAEER